jgi:hypothetical protein
MLCGLVVGKIVEKDGPENGTLGLTLAGRVLML